MEPMTQVKVLTITGGVLIVIFVVFMGVFQTIFTSVMENVMVISTESSAYDAFITPPVPMYLQFYVFNVTNPDEIRYYGRKPKVQEIGPYTYEELTVKMIEDWNSEDGTVAYQTNTTYSFIQEMSNPLTEDDPITIINPVMLALASRAENLSSEYKAATETLFLRYNQSLFITKDVSEILFRGYEEPLLSQMGKILGIDNVPNRFGFFYGSLAELLEENKTLANLLWPEIERGMDIFETHKVGEILFSGYALPEFNFDFSDFGNLFNIPVLNKTEGLNGTIYEILVKLGLDPPAFLEPNEIAMMKNGTTDGTYRVKTGELDIDEYLHITEWNNEGSLPYWHDSYCDMINGTDGSQFPPGVTKDDVLYLYTSELCRSLHLIFEKEVDYYGITLYRFILPEDIFAAPEDNPDNCCFCRLDGTVCPPQGFLPLAPCAGGIPLVLSTPHFYMGDPEEIAKLDGINPVKEWHETALDIEPTTGIVMRGDKKIQMSLYLKKYGNFPAFRNVPEVFFPIFWINESAKATQDDAESMDKVLTVPFQVVYGVGAGLVAIGLILVIAGIINYRKIKNGTHKGLVKQDSINVQLTDVSSLSKHSVDSLSNSIKL